MLGNWKKWPIVSIGTSGITDDEEITRILTINVICLIVGGSIIVIGGLLLNSLHWPTRLFVIFAGELIINCCALPLNSIRRHKAARSAVYYLQCLAIPVYAIILPWLLRLEFIVILQIVMVYLIFRQRGERNTALVFTIIELVGLETIYFFQDRTRASGDALSMPGTMSYGTGFLIQFVLVAAIIFITIIQIRPYVKSKDENPELVKANQFIKLFVAQLTHELRTSMNNIHQVSQLLRKEAENQEYLKPIQPLPDIIYSASCDAQNIVNNVLDMAEIESGKTPITVNEAFRVRPFFEKMLEVYKIVAHEERMSLQLFIDMPEVIISDPLNITQIVSNLVTNAIKFSLRGSTVIVELKRRDPNWELKVSNFGPGIPEDKQPFIFDPFVTGKSGRIQGTGLGLFIVRKKVEALNGTIQVQGKRGGYTIFTVTLPLIEGKSREITEGDKLRSDKDLDNLGNIHVLMAEDSKLTSFLMFRFLQEQGCKVTMVSNGRELLEKAQEGYAGDRPDIIILDCHMPVLNGEQTIRQLKKIPGLSHIPIIVTTGDLYSDMLDRMLDAGADTYLKKPIDHVTLQKTIRSYLKKQA